MIKVAPSILSADFSKLGAEVEDIRLGGADYVHFDVMDGRFVPNISIGIPVLKSLRKATDMLIDAHLMIVEPIRYAEAFCQAGADLVNVHVEAEQGRSDPSYDGRARLRGAELHARYAPEDRGHPRIYR